MGSFLAVRGLLPSCRVQAPEHMGSVVAVLGLSCPAPCGILVPTRDRTHVPCIERWILNHWTTREVPLKKFLKGL